MISFGAGIMLVGVFAVFGGLMLLHVRQTRSDDARLELSLQASQQLSKWQAALWGVVLAERTVITTRTTVGLMMLDDSVLAARKESDSYEALVKVNPLLVANVSQQNKNVVGWLDSIAAFSRSMKAGPDAQTTAVLINDVISKNTQRLSAIVISNLDAIRTVRENADAAISAERQWQKRTIWWILVTSNVLLVLVTITSGILILMVLDRRRAEAEVMEASERLSAADVVRSRLLATASHDLRQPLQAIMLFTTAMRRRVADNTYVSSLVDGVTIAAGSLERMFNGLLDISKLDAGIVAADRTDFSVAQMLHHLVVEFAAIAEAKGVSFQVIGVGAMVHTDPVLLESMVRNIVSNAIKYTIQGHVVVTCRQADDRTVLIEVSDTGAGISEDEHENIFREFHRIGSPGNTEEGLGLGLAIVSRLSKLLNVTVEVHSIMGVGSTFSLRVPVSESLADPKPIRLERVALADLQTNIRVLLVDDDNLLRRAVSAALEEHGMVVTALSSSEETIAYFSGSKAHDVFDVALVDYNLGHDSTGVSLLDQLAARFGLSLPALIMTGEQSADVIEELGDSGYMWLQKPVDSIVLISTLAGLAASPNIEEPADLMSALQPAFAGGGMRRH